MFDRAKSPKSVAEALARHEQLPFENPMLYYCSPQGATPDYVPSTDINAFLAYGFLVCNVAEEDTSCTYTPADCWDAREQFLNTVQNAIEHYDDFEREKKSVQDEALEPRVYLPDKEDPEHEGALADWYLDLIDAEGTLCFTWLWSEADPVVIWLDHEAVDTTEKRQACLAAIEDARTLLTYLKGAGSPTTEED